MTAVRPRIPDHADPAEGERLLARLLDQLVALLRVRNPVLWFYMPMMCPAAAHLARSAVVYDCMDELSAFRFAPPGLAWTEADLLRAADVVFTGGQAIHEAKLPLHDNVNAFPSSVDHGHFARARAGTPEPADQAAIPAPRLGFAGAIDERIDLGRLAATAKARPDWSLVVVGPVAKLEPAELPRASNIHWLGQRAYADLPAYMAGWDVALMPFALNEATRFISPTKTPEYLAAGCPVVSTPVRDLVRGYGALPGVRVASGAEEFTAACAAAALAEDKAGPWRAGADRALAGQSWALTQARTAMLVAEARARAMPPLYDANASSEQDPAPIG